MSAPVVIVVEMACAGAVLWLLAEAEDLLYWLTRGRPP